MTTEVAILNKHAVALAADSAVTVRYGKGQHRADKIFTSANKVFALSRHHPVGIMIYGTADFMHVPWETIIKDFRHSLGQQACRTLNDYVDLFIQYILQRADYFPETSRAEYVHHSISHLFLDLEETLRERIKAEFSAPSVSVRQVRSIGRRVLNSFSHKWMNAPLVPGMQPNAKDKLHQHEREIGEIFDQVFEAFPFSRAQKQLAIATAHDFMIRWIPGHLSPHTSGIVIAGFGTDEHYPAATSLHFDGISDAGLRYFREETVAVSATQDAIMRPFAQGDMVELFLNGVDRRYFDAITRDIARLLAEYPQTILDAVPGLPQQTKKTVLRRVKKSAQATFNDSMKALFEYGEQRFSKPVLEIVAILPKDELASMAETLVALTSFKRRMSWEAETVGGPVDVAVISKGDGLIWIKRKHYFDPQLNQHFFTKLRGEAQ